MVLRVARQLQFHVARLERGGGAPIEEARIVLVFVGFDGASHRGPRDDSANDLLRLVDASDGDVRAETVRARRATSRGGGGGRGVAEGGGEARLAGFDSRSERRTNASRSPFPR